MVKVMLKMKVHLWHYSGCWCVPFCLFRSAIVTPHTPQIQNGSSHIITLEFPPTNVSHLQNYENESVI
jgi:hypothetical protein